MESHNSQYNTSFGDDVGYGSYALYHSTPLERGDSRRTLSSEGSSGMYPEDVFFAASPSYDIMMQQGAEGLYEESSEEYYGYSDSQASQAHDPQAAALIFARVLPDIELAATQASESAMALTNAQSRLSPETLYITSEAIEQYIRDRGDKTPAGEEVQREAIQSILYDNLSWCFQACYNTEQLAEAVMLMLREAAWQIQLRVEGHVVHEISRFAILVVLDELKKVYNPSLSQGPQPLSGSSSVKDQYICHAPGCNQKVFGRSADLERHIKMIHVSEDKRRKYICDYKKCDRYHKPFYRQDHFRDHLRNQHKEDLPLRSLKTDPQWWATRSHRAIYGGWWRCNRCLLVRVDIKKHGFACSGCGHHCEIDRQRFRQSAG